MGRLDGTCAFVTGASGGIGRSICERFVAEGARVAAVDIDLAGAQAALGDALNDGRAVALRCDVGDGEAVRQAIAQAVAAFGRLNVLCNVAGGSTLQDGPVTEAPDDEFWRAIRLDLYGTFACCKHGLPELIKAGGGSVINMTSVVALMAVPGRDCYAAAKGGVIALTQSMAGHYAPQRIRVNAIAPGITLTPRVVARREAGNSGGSALESRHLLGLVEPLDVAQMAVYLASDDARMVTGQVLRVDSGLIVS